MKNHKMKLEDQSEKLKLVLLFKEPQNLLKKLKILNCEKALKLKIIIIVNNLHFDFFNFDL